MSEKLEEVIPQPEKYFGPDGDSKCYIYCRVSTKKQDINKQFEHCYNYAKEHSLLPPLKNVFFDNAISGATDWRDRELYKLKTLKKGNILIVAELSRLGRDFINTCHFIDIVLSLGCVIHEIKSNLIVTTDLDMNDRFKMIFSCIQAEMERDNTKQRTKIAMQSKVVRAKIPNKLDDHKEVIEKSITEGKNPNQIAQELKCNKSQVYKFVRKHGMIK